MQLSARLEFSASFVPGWYPSIWGVPTSAGFEGEKQHCSTYVKHDMRFSLFLGFRTHPEGLKNAVFETRDS